MPEPHPPTPEIVIGPVDRKPEPAEGPKPQVSVEDGIITIR